jgi:hypothetical protein
MFVRVAVPHPEGRVEQSWTLRCFGEYALGLLEVVDEVSAVPLDGATTVGAEPCEVVKPFDGRIEKAALIGDSRYEKIRGPLARDLVMHCHVERRGLQVE